MKLGADFCVVCAYKDCDFGFSVKPKHYKRLKSALNQFRTLCGKYKGCKIYVYKNEEILLSVTSNYWDLDDKALECSEIPILERAEVFIKAIEILNNMDSPYTKNNLLETRKYFLHNGKNYILNFDCGTNMAILRLEKRNEK